MTNDQDALAAVMQADGVEDASQPQDHVAPALSCRRPEIELAQQSAGGCVLRKTLLYPEPGQAVQNSELFFPQSLVDDEPGKAGRQPGGFLDDGGRAACTTIGRTQDDLRP